MTEHSPLPWHAGARNEYGNVAIHASRNHSRVPPICTCHSEVGDGPTTDANAAYIVKACNLHEELVWLVQDYLKFALSNHLRLDAELIGPWQTLADRAASALKKAEDT